MRNEIKGPEKKQRAAGQDPRKRVRERGPLAAPCYTPQMLSPAGFSRHRGCFLFFSFFARLCDSPDNASMLPVLVDPLNWTMRLAIVVLLLLVLLLILKVLQTIANQKETEPLKLQLSSSTFLFLFSFLSCSFLQRSFSTTLPFGLLFLHAFFRPVP